MTHIVRLATLVALCASVLAPASGRAADNLIPGKIHIIKEAKLTKMVAKPVVAFPVPAPMGSGNPTVNGGYLGVRDTGDGTGFFSTLPALGWKGLGNPAGSTGYKYKGAGTLVDPCKVVLVKSKVIKFVCKDDQALNPQLQGDSAINLALGADNYCAEFGGEIIKNQTGLFKAKDADPPGACTSFSTTTTSSTTSTTLDPLTPCCNNFTHGVFTSGPAADTCGTILDAVGGTYNTVTCGGLYFGGGENGVSLPAITPDLGATVVEITSCSGQTGTVGPTTSTETGSLLNCSEPGCRFGGPLAIPNVTNTPTSTCVLNTVDTAISGTINCEFGTQSVTLPLDSEIFLTGDEGGDASGTIDGIQPCPLCIGPLGSETCSNGPNIGGDCVPNDTNQGGATTGYPTSHDCPPEPSLSIGTIPINLALTTGTVSWTATPAPNPTSTGQVRVFCGYCRDRTVPTASGAFQNPFVQCWENGMAMTACTEPFDNCEQRDQGAYGPGGQAVRTITVFGTPAGPVVDGAPHAQKLVTNFCIPPTFDPVVDNSANLPGPGTLALTGDTELCSSANPCPEP